MDVVLLVIEALKFIFPAYCANATPVLAGGGTKMDFGRNFVDGKPIQNHYKTLAELPAETELSRLISKELKKKGFNFVGPTIVYAHMQATGMVNDHLVDCYRHRELSAGN